MIDIRTLELKATNLTPSIIEETDEPWVSFGDDNDFSLYLVELAQLTALHTAILDKKIKMDVGNGLFVEGNDKKTQKFIDNINLNYTLLLAARDFEIHGGFYLQVAWEKGKKKLANFSTIPFEKMKTGQKDKKGNIKNFYFAEKWEKHMDAKDITVMPAFSTEDNLNKVQIVPCFIPAAGNDYYPLPSYEGALIDIDTLYQISNFHNNAIKNNFAPGCMIIFRGPEPPKEEKDKIVKKLKDKYKSSSSAGEPVIFFLDGEQEEPKIEMIQATDLDKLFDQLSKTANSNVATAHSMPRALANLEEAGSLGNSKNIIEAQMIFFNDYTQKQQQFILNCFNSLLEINKLKDVGILNSSPSLLLYSEALLEKVLTKNEIRDLFGYEEIKEDEDTIEEETQGGNNGQ